MFARKASNGNSRYQTVDASEHIEKQFSALPDKKDVVFDVELGVLMMNG